MGETESQYDRRNSLREEWIDSKRSSGWEEHELDAAQAGFDYVFDNYADPQHRVGDIDDFDGGSEAMDMAEGIAEFDDSWPRGRRDRGHAADCVYDGMRAAIKIIKETSGED